MRADANALSRSNGPDTRTLFTTPYLTRPHQVRQKDDEQKDMGAQGHERPVGQPPDHSDNHLDCTHDAYKHPSVPPGRSGCRSAERASIRCDVDPRDGHEKGIDHHQRKDRCLWPQLQNTQTSEYPVSRQYSRRFAASIQYPASIPAASQPVSSILQ